MWKQVCNTLLGLWLMIAPGILGYEALAADNGHIVGPIVVTFSVIAYWDATRTVGKWNILCGLWLLVCPWLLNYTETLPLVLNMISGVLILIFAFWGGAPAGDYGGGWSSLWKKDPMHIKAAEEKE